MQEEIDPDPRFHPSRVAVSSVVALFAALRLCHVRLLWADEDYHLAAAINVLHGNVPYRDFWYDKPPLNAIYYLLIGGYSGWPLRILDTLYVLAACWLAFLVARAWWGEVEGCISAVLLSFSLAFYLPSAVISFAADALMIVPHLAAIYCVLTRRALLAGLCCAIAFLVNAKAVFVIAICALWFPGAWLLLSLGFAIPLLLAATAALVSGAWPGYYEQVWRWGWLYAAGSPVLHPFKTGLVRSLDWLGFHAALAVGTAFAFSGISRRDRWKAASWLALSFLAVCLGTRFAPHYFLQLLPAMVIVSSRGIALAWSRYRTLTAVLLGACLLVPLIRFAPRYAFLAYDNVLGRAPRWSDAAMDEDSQQASREIVSAGLPSDTLFVWGYRPDIYVYTRLTSASRFWDSQPLTGVPADRHLHAIDVIYGGAAARNRRQLIQSRPTWLVDGLGLLNPKLSPTVYPELRPWLSHYKLVAQTRLSLIYRLADSPVTQQDLQRPVSRR